MLDKEKIQNEINDLENKMNQADFWKDKHKAQEVIKKISELKNELLGSLKYDSGNAILTIISGAGGDDAEDFTGMLLKMYYKFAENNGWQILLIHEHKNDFGGYRNISVEIIGKNVYKALKNESGVHRLVRISPFNSKKLRHTSFSLVEVVPKIQKSNDAIIIKPEDIRIEFSKSGGPGGQNVNKRETAVRIVHLDTNISVSASTERSQEQNRERVMEVLKGKLFKKREEDEKKLKMGLSISSNLEIEWGNQIRSYVLHPYKMVKDHRTGVETSDVDGVFEGGMINIFIEAEPIM